jgi:hypothetical protein
VTRGKPTPLGSGVLRKLGDEVRACRAPGRLGELADRAAGPLVDAGRIAQEVRAQPDYQERAKKDAAAQREADKASAARARQFEQARRKSVRAANSAALAEVTARARELERIYRRVGTSAGEHPVDVLRDLRVIRYLAAPAAPKPAGIFERIGRAVTGPASGRWHSTADSAVSFPYAALTQWGDGTRDAIRPVLAALHAQEDRLRAQLGSRSRQNRPDLTR